MRRLHLGAVQLNSLQFLIVLLSACVVGISSAGEPMLAQAVSAGDRGRVLVLAGGTLIDGTGGRPLTNAAVVIRGNRIEAVGPRNQVQVPAGAQVLDTSGKFIMPGLIDSHFHGSDWMTGDLWLSFGVTTAVQFGDRLAQAKQPGESPAWPRIFFSGPHVAGPDEYTDLGKVGSPGKVTTVEQALEEVRKRKASGAVFVLVSENLKMHLLSPVAELAHQLGLPVIGHQVNAIESIRAGLDGVEHITGVGFAAITDPKLKSELTELSRTKGPTRAPISHPISNPEYHMRSDEVQKIVQLMVDRKVHLNPTLVTRWQRVQPRTQQFFEQYKKMSEHPRWSSITEKVRQSWLETLIPYPERTDAQQKEQEQIGYRRTQELLRNFVKAGGKIFSGTDFAGASVPGLRLHQELRLLVDAGLTTTQAILTATQYPSQLFRLDKDLGTVQPGKLADLLVLDADPLQQIENLAKISHVILDGRPVETNFRADSVVTPASAGPTGQK